MVLGVRAGEQVICQPEFLEQVQETQVIAFVHFLRGGLFRVRPHRDGCAMRIRSGYHQYLPAAQALVTGKDISRKVRPGQVSYMDLCVCVWPRGVN